MTIFKIVLITIEQINYGYISIGWQRESIWSVIFKNIYQRLAIYGTSIEDSLGGTWFWSQEFQEICNIIWMVLMQEQQANIITHFGSLWVNYTFTRTQKSNLISQFGGLHINQPAWKVNKTVQPYQQVHQVKRHNIAAVFFLLSHF